jgi:hypothetical protein
VLDALRFRSQYNQEFDFAFQARHEDSLRREIERREQKAMATYEDSNISGGDKAGKEKEKDPRPRARAERRSQPRNQGNQLEGDSASDSPESSQSSSEESEGSSCSFKSDDDFSGEDEPMCEVRATRSNTSAESVQAEDTFSPSDPENVPTVSSPGSISDSILNNPQSVRVTRLSAKLASIQTEETLSTPLPEPSHAVNTGCGSSDAAGGALVEMVTVAFSPPSPATQASDKAALTSSGKNIMVSRPDSNDASGEAAPTSSNGRKKMVLRPDSDDADSCDWEIHPIALKAELNEAEAEKKGPLRLDYTRWMLKKNKWKRTEVDFVAKLRSDEIPTATLTRLDGVKFMLAPNTRAFHVLFTAGGLELISVQQLKQSPDKSGLTVIFNRVLITERAIVAAFSQDDLTDTLSNAAGRSITSVRLGSSSLKRMHKDQCAQKKKVTMVHAGDIAYSDHAHNIVGFLGWFTMNNLKDEDKHELMTSLKKYNFHYKFIKTDIDLVEQGPPFSDSVPGA